MQEEESAASGEAAAAAAATSNGAKVTFKPPPLDMSSSVGDVEPPEVATPGPASASDGKAGSLPTGSSASDKKKIGHRRVDPTTQQVTYKKVPTSQIMGAIQLGIANSVGSLASTPERDLLLQDFDVVDKVSFPTVGSNTTPVHSFGDFKFKAYAPIAFRYFRDLFSIKTEDFLSSVCIEPLRELSNPGASGSIFYVSRDDQFIIKTVQHKEAEFLQKLLPGYYMNLNQNPRTLLPKFFGLFCYQSIGLGKNIRLLAMNNLLPSTIRLHQKYDLKGSTYKRKASRVERNKPSPTLKDLDFLEDNADGLYLEALTYEALMKTISRDCLVLESFKIMDYSLLIGMHNLDLAGRERQAITEEGIELDVATCSAADAPDKPDPDERKVHRHKSLLGTWESIQADAVPIDLGDDYPTGGIPARNAKGERVLIFLGIIDILQNYRLFKKLEHTMKSVFHDGDTISVHQPRFYASRFQDFMRANVFKKIPSLDVPEAKGAHRKFRSLVQSFIALKHSPSKRRGRKAEPRAIDGVPQTPAAAQTARPDLVPALDTPASMIGVDRHSALRSSGRRAHEMTPAARGLLQRQETIEGSGERRVVERLFAPPGGTPAAVGAKTSASRTRSSGSAGGGGGGGGDASRPVASSSEVVRADELPASVRLVTSAKMDIVELGPLRPIGEDDAAAAEWTPNEERVNTAFGPLTVGVVGNTKRHAILTYHDLGMNASSSFQGFFQFSEMYSLAERFCVYHLNAPGQEDDAPPLPDNMTYPTMDDLAQMVLSVVEHFKIRTFIGMGVGLGANVLCRFALKYPKMVDALILINGSVKSIGWTDWAYQKVNIGYLRSRGMTSFTVDNLLWYHFGKHLDECNGDLVESFRRYFGAVAQPANLAALMESYARRSAVALQRDGDPSLHCATLQIVGAASPHIKDSIDLNTRLNPAKTEWIKLSDCSGLVLEECPEKATEAIILFLQGLGYLPSLSHAKWVQTRQHSVQLESVPLAAGGGARPSKRASVAVGLRSGVHGNPVVT